MTLCKNCKKKSCYLGWGKCYDCAYTDYRSSLASQASPKGDTDSSIILTSENAVQLFTEAGKKLKEIGEKNHKEEFDYICKINGISPAPLEDIPSDVDIFKGDITLDVNHLLEELIKYVHVVDGKGIRFDKEFTDILVGYTRPKKITHGDIENRARKKYKDSRHTFSDLVDIITMYAQDHDLLEE